MKGKLTLLLVFALLLSVVPSAVAQPTETATEATCDQNKTPNEECSDSREPESTETPTTTETPTPAEVDVDKDRIIEWAESGKDLTEDEARAVYRWYTDNIGRFDADQRELVEGWVTAEIAGKETDPVDRLDNRVYDFGPEMEDGDEDKETRTYQPAVDAINDSDVREGELPDVYEYRGEQIFPDLRLEYEEWDGNQTTLILRADKDMTISLNDAWLASAETDRPAPRYHVELQEGLNVVQLPTVPDNANEEYIAVSSTDYVETISDPYKPFIRRIGKKHIPAVAGGSILGFATLFVLFASFRKNRYKGRLVHIAEVLKMR